MTLGISLAALGCAGGSAPATSTVGGQLEFGVQMARRGLWNEALFRFEQAQRSNPNDPRLLNNLAVAYEAVGRYEQALATYQKAVRMAPGDSQLRQNMSRFSQFYESFRPDEADAGETESATEPPAEPTSEPTSEPVPTPEQAPDTNPEPSAEPTPEPTPEQAPDSDLEPSSEPSVEPIPGEAPEQPSASTPEEAG